ncbi:MAG: SPASM domain-containing protein [Deltaproteobacteria bacterium]|nr:SPASM domain-containing protein [Deltaproteobacteria bacterium]
MPREFLDWRKHRLPYPTSLTIDIHSHCNARCKICPYPTLKDTLPMGFMEEALFHRLIDEFAELKRQQHIRGHVIFCNMGELFLDPQVLDKIAYVRDRGLELIIQTNAALMTPDKTDALVEMGYASPTYISFHGITPEVYRNIMGLPYEKALSHTRYAIEKLPDVKIRSFSYQYPLGEARKVLRFWQSVKPGLNVKLHVPNSRTGLLPHLARTPLKYPGPWLAGCKKGLPLRDMVVAFNGQAVLCCEDMGRHGVLGDVSQSSLVDVWNSQRAHKIMDYLYGGGWGERDSKFLCRRCEFGLSTQFRRLVKNVDHNWQMLTKATF